MSVREDINELSALNTEIQTLQARLKALRAARKAVEARLIDYLDANAYPGIAFKDTTLVLQDVKRRQYVPKTERVEKARAFLRGYGAEMSDRDVENLFEQMRGEVDSARKITLHGRR
jgi:hypothetical protein